MMLYPANMTPPPGDHERKTSSSQVISRLAILRAVGFLGLDHRTVSKTHIIGRKIAHIGNVIDLAA